MFPEEGRRGCWMAECTACCLSEGHHSCPCRTAWWCIQPSTCPPQWLLLYALGERVDIPPHFNLSGGQHCTTEQVMHSWLPLSLMPRKRIFEPCNDQNINGTNKYQSASSLYYPDLYISTDQACLWNFPEFLAKSTKILAQRLHFQCDVLTSPLGAQESCLSLLLGWLMCHCLAFLNHPVRPSATVLTTPKEEGQPSPDTTHPESVTLTIVTESLHFMILKTWTSQFHLRQAAMEWMCPNMASLWNTLKFLGLWNKGLY